jgi:AcrR family transcriptional regulator
VTSEDDAHIWHLHHGEDMSVRQIAKHLGINRGKVFRALNRHREAVAEDDEYDDLDDKALFDADPVPELTPPFTFVGAVWEPAITDSGDEPVWSLDVRFMDATPVSCSWAEVMRWYQHRANDEGDWETARQVREDIKRQLIAASVMLGQEPSGVWLWAPEYAEPPSSLRAV